MQVGNPINVAIGNKYQREPDLHGSKLSFVRHYNSNPATRFDGALGPHWTHSFGQRIEHLEASEGADEVVKALRAEGSTVTFRRANAAWKADANVHASLEEITGPNGNLLGWIFIPCDGRDVEKYDSRGLLTNVAFVDGSSIALIYDGGNPGDNANDSHLTRVESEDGRAMSFSYGSEGRISRLLDSGGQLYEYSYDALGRLDLVTLPGGDNRRYHYNEPQHTQGTDLPTALTGITDENGTRFATFKYATDGRAISTEHGGSAEKFSVQYGTDGSADITTPDGRVERRLFTAYSGVARTTAVQDLCQACTARNTRFAYDMYGRLDTATDAAGIVTDYNFNPEGLLVQMVESANRLPTKRITQTDWHPTLRIPTERRVYDSGNTLVSKTNWTYNARGQTLTASTHDTRTGAIRTVTTAYCEQGDVISGACPRVGLVTSVDGPRTDVADISRYVYRMTDEASCAASPATCSYRKGDLWKVINALGHITETLTYDGSGRPLSMKDANGVVTDFHYHPRGWLTARTVHSAQ